MLQAMEVVGRVGEKSLGEAMSPQVTHLKKLILSAQQGNENDIRILRRICMDISEAAPVHALITIGECLVQVGLEAEREQILQN